jgi:acyl phosphate:glycerol-3-phosphate acyltransferase
MFIAATIIIVSWLLGSIPSAYIMGKMMLKADIRTLGSGNSGAANAFRVLGLKGAIPVFLFDFFKGFFPVYISLRSGLAGTFPALPLALLAGIAAFLGHVFPVYIGFKGGKGVATGAGVLTAVYPLLFPACLVVFLPVALITRKISLASIFTAISVPFWYLGLSFIRGEEPDICIMIFTVSVSLLVILKHRNNIRNLLGGTEKPLF